MDELVSLLSTGSLSSGPDGWEYASVIIGALGAIGLWVFFTFFAKGAEKRKPAEDCKKFFLMQGNFAEDFTKIVYFYMSIRTLVASLELFGVEGSGFWLFLKTAIGQLVWYRFVYEVIMAVVRKNADKK
ncbi:hypothetical protein IKF03_02040 [Candidatus Saccharibacteria bacterium]|nr:hypothetical protein [Candidatus Saccharibacteria bacterium]